MHIAFLGSSLLSSYWNGAATYYRGIIKAMSKRGYRTTFYEPDAFGRQEHRDMDPPEWAEVVVYPPTQEAAIAACRDASKADIVVKASGIGVFDEEIITTLAAMSGEGRLRLFWDVDAPATLAEIERAGDHLLRAAIPRLDGVLTYGGGPAVVSRYKALGARHCVPIYNALDPESHYPVPKDPRFAADLAFLGNRLPDREARVAEYFFKPARLLPEKRFLLAGSGWEPWQCPPNVAAISHLPTRDHNAFNSTPLAVINIARDSMAGVGFSPATRVFEAAGAGACIITDAWEGIEAFLTPGEEILVARHGGEVARFINELTPERAEAIGRAARTRIMREHTYDIRAAAVADLLDVWTRSAERSVPA